MLDLFGGLRRMLKKRYVTIDNAVFRLHWMVTTLILIAFSLVVTTRQYVGNPIECLKLGNIPSGFLDLYCWIHLTYTMPDAFTKQVGKEVPHPGIDNSKGGERKYYAYYQWVCFVLFLQGVCFYAPYYLWSTWESGLIKAVSLGMQIAIISEEERGHKKKIITDYLVRHIGCHRWYALKYFFCELLCLINVTGQMILMDYFFDGDYLTYGIDVVRYTQNDTGVRVDPMAYVFPTVTKCTFRDFGSSGDVQRYDVLCILPLNALNGKIYIFIWFWFVLLGILSILVVITRIVVIVAPCTRQHFLHVRCRLAVKEHINIIIKRTNIGDWFVLYMLGKNLDGMIFREVVCEMAKSLERNKAEELEDLVA